MLPRPRHVAHKVKRELVKMSWPWQRPVTSTRVSSQTWQWGRSGLALPLHITTPHSCFWSHAYKTFLWMLLQLHDMSYLFYATLRSPTASIPVSKVTTIYSLVSRMGLCGLVLQSNILYTLYFRQGFPMEEYLYQIMLSQERHGALLCHFLSFRLEADIDIVGKLIACTSVVRGCFHYSCLWFSFPWDFVLFILHLFSTNPVVRHITWPCKWISSW